MIFDPAGEMAYDFHVMSRRIEDESGIIRGVIALTNARLSVRASARRNCSCIKCVDRLVIFGLKREMQSTARVGLFRNPELQRFSTSKAGGSIAALRHLHASISERS